MSDNPLKKYSTRPGTYVTLPSKGRYYSIHPKLTADGDLEIRPMTAADEIRLKNPDGLLNSDALFQVIEHIAPGISDASKIPTPDLDVIVIGMRIATYGELMDVGITCKSCKHDENYQVNLVQVLANARTISTENQVIIDNLKINLRPHTAESNTMMSNYQVELIRAAKQYEANVKNDQNEFNDKMREIMVRGATLLFDIASKHIMNIETPDDGIVTDSTFIREWLTDLPAPDYQKIRDAVNKLSKEAIDRNMKFKCVNCDAVNEVEAAFDPANFFGNSSL